MNENAHLRRKLTERDLGVSDLSEFKTLVVSRLAAQHAEILRLREALAAAGVVRALPVSTNQPASARSSTSISTGR